MKVTLLSNETELLLEHEQEGNGHDQIYSRKIAAETRVGQCHFQIIDTGACLLWLGDYQMQQPFLIQTASTNDELKIIVQWPTSIDNDYAKVFEKTLLVYRIPFLSGHHSPIELRCTAGKGRLLLLQYSTKFIDASRLPVIKTIPRQNDLALDSSMASIVQHMLYYPVSIGHQQQYLRIKCEEFYVLFHDAATAVQKKDFIPEPIIEKLINIDLLIRRQVDQNFTVTQLAKTFSLNTEQLKRYFKLYYGNTIHQYILAIKMELAEQLIQKSDQSLKEISFALGFKTDAHFSEAFKNYFGYPPGFLRKKNNSHS
ncbi:helix-turn-helix domain-containing protein [Terrimonas pollutisoli]|uniref:helix-turn-helix domain-containing protein n=1 Tax=Terrimonas pollutisoli TaxID=3034147 RepID=UPI0023EAD8E3|nr:AraC family transcriptional regulator [Terrimonas sp. H1YJ31]